MLKYNLCYIKQGSKVLLLNRDYPGWMGCWNGVGGKLEPNELPRVSMLREVAEETGLVNIDVHFKGFKTWSSGWKTGVGGLYLYAAYLAEDYNYETPKRTDEGILEWKDISWILHRENLGVAYNLPSSLRIAFEDEGCFDHHSIFEGNRLVEQIVTEIDPRLEDDRPARQQYLKKYLGHSD